MCLDVPNTSGVSMRCRAAVAVLALSIAIVSGSVARPAAADGTTGAGITPGNPAPPLQLDATTTIPNGAAAASPNATGAPANATALVATSATADLVLGRAEMARSNWPAALTLLTRAATTEPKNADVHNYLGFVTRNMGQYAKALTHYGQALKLDPKHRGALEYRGEAYVKLGQLTKAKADLASLKRICGTNCEQYVDLAKVIAAYKPRK